MGRNNRAKPKKKKLNLNIKTKGGIAIKDLPEGTEVYLLTREEYEEVLKDNARDILKGVRSLLEYNMILENHLTPEQAETQSRLMEIRSEAILNGDLTWDEVDEFLEEYRKQQEKESGQEK